MNAKLRALTEGYPANLEVAKKVNGSYGLSKAKELMFEEEIFKKGYKVNRIKLPL